MVSEIWFTWPLQCAHRSLIVRRLPNGLPSWILYFLARFNWFQCPRIIQRILKTNPARRMVPETCDHPRHSGKLSVAFWTVIRPPWLAFLSPPSNLSISCVQVDHATVVLKVRHSNPRSVGHLDDRGQFAIACLITTPGMMKPYAVLWHSKSHGYGCQSPVSGWWDLVVMGHAPSTTLMRKKIT